MRARDVHPTLTRGAAAVVTLLVLAACGGDGSTDPTGVPSPSPDSAARLNMVLLSHIDLATLSLPASADVRQLTTQATSAAGNYGYTSPDGRRFALTGVSDGLSIVEVTDPSHPVRIAHVPGAASQWREVRTYGHYVYVTTEARVGMDIIDMANPSQPRKVGTYTDTF